MTDTQSAETRAREALANEYINQHWNEPPPNGYTDAEWRFLRNRADDQINALTAANLTIVDAAELAQLRADLDLAMEFRAACFMSNARAREALQPAYERWQAARQEAE